MKQLTKNQKKKIMYSLLGIFGIAIITFITIMFYGDIQWAEELKNKIAASLITYASGAFLGVKIMVFAVQEVIKNKKKSAIEHLGHFVKNDIKNKGEIIMKTKDNVLVREFEYNGIRFQVDNKKGIRISFDNLDAMGAEELYNKLKQANQEFLEHFRKSIAGEK